MPHLNPNPNDVNVFVDSSSVVHGPQFDRDISVDVILPDGAGVPGAGVTLNFKNLRMVFHVEKTSSSEPNRCTLDIYNLSQDSRDRISHMENSIVVISAGYKEANNIETLFRGRIDFYAHKLMPPDIVTKIEASDGGEFYQDVISIGIADKTVSQVFKEVMAKLKWPQKNLIDDIKFQMEDPEMNRLCFTGFGKDILDILAQRGRFNWSFQNGATKLILSDFDDKSTPLILTPETGTIGVPEKTDKESVRTKRLPKEIEAERKKEPGYIVTTLLKPSAEPGGRAFMKSDFLDIDSRFPIGDVVHDGDNYGEGWTSKIKLLISSNIDKKIVPAEIGVFA